MNETSTAIMLATSSLLTQVAAAADDTLQEIVVTATLRSTGVEELPQSVTVLNEEMLRAAGVQHFEDVLGLILRS